MKQKGRRLALDTIETFIGLSAGGGGLERSTQVLSYVTELSTRNGARSIVR